MMWSMPGTSLQDRNRRFPQCHRSEPGDGRDLTSSEASPIPSISDYRYACEDYVTFIRLKNTLSPSRYERYRQSYHFTPGVPRISRLRRAGGSGI